MATNSLFDNFAKRYSAPDQGNTWDQYQDDIDRIAKEEGVDPKWVTAIVRAESGGKKLALSDKGAQGLMQLMPPTAKEMGVTDSNDPLQNIRGGSRYFKQQMDAHGGDPSLALAAYNAGPGNVKKYGGIPPFEETQEYVKKVQAYYDGRPYQKPQAVRPVKVAGSDQPAANMFDSFAERYTQPPAQEQGSIYDNPPPPGADTLNLGLPQAQAPALGRSQQGRLSSAGGSYMRGIGGIIASLPKAIGEGAVQLANKFGDDPIWGNPDKVTPEETTAYKAGEAIEKWFNKFAVNPEYRDEFWASDVASGAGTLTGFFASGIAARIAKIPALVATMGVGATATAVEGVDDYLATLAKDEKADPKIREAAYNWNAILGTSEALPVMQALNVVDRFTAGGVKAILKQGVKGGIEELVQEVLQSVGQNKIAKDWVGYDPERGLWAGTERAGEVGFTLGFAMNALAAMIGARRAGNTGAPPPADDVEDRPAPSAPGFGQTGVTGHITDALAAADVPAEAGGLPALAGDATSGQQGSDIPPPEAAEGDQDQTGPVPGVGATGDALQRESETQGPADEVPTPKISYFDNRLKRESFRFGLEEMKNDLQVGGDVSYITDEQGAITGRTPSLNPDWYQGMMDNPEYRLKGGVKGVWGAVDKALAGERLGVRQSRVIEGMLDQVTGERTTPENLEYARKQLEIAREARASAGMPDTPDWLFEEEDYPDEADGLTRTFMELQANAHDMSPELGAQVDDLMESQQDDATILTAIIEATERYNRGRQSEISGQVDQAAQAQAGVPDTGQEPLAGEPAPAGVPGAPAAGPGYVEAAPRPEQGLTDEELAAIEAAPVPVPAEPTARKPTEEPPQAAEAAPAAPEVAAGEVAPGERRKKKKPGIKKERRDIGREQRRENWAYRKDIDAMAPEEKNKVIQQLRDDAMINRLTGLGSKLAWDAAEKKAFIGSIDADSLKYINDNMGKSAGNELLVNIGKAIKAEFGEDAYHISGDEYWVHDDNLESLDERLVKVQNELKTATATGPGGTVTGLGFSYGIAEDEDTADRKMKADKQTRTDEGLRVERGERPEGVELKGEVVPDERKAEPAVAVPPAVPVQEQKPKKPPIKKIKEPKPLDEIIIVETVKVEETGEVVEIEMTAEEMLKEADDRISSLEQLKECIRS